MTFYIASRPAHIPRWQALRAAGVRIISTWIDDPPIAPESMHADLATRCMREAASADVLVLYCEPGEVLKGALMEVGAALGAGRRVRCVGSCESVKDIWRRHPNWRDCVTVDEAFGVEDSFTKFGHP